MATRFRVQETSAFTRCIVADTEEPIFTFCTVTKAGESLPSAVVQARARAIVETLNFLGNSLWE